MHMTRHLPLESSQAGDPGLKPGMSLDRKDVAWLACRCLARSGGAAWRCPLVPVFPAPALSPMVRSATGVSLATGLDGRGIAVPPVSERSQWLARAFPVARCFRVVVVGTVLGSGYLRSRPRRTFRNSTDPDLRRLDEAAERSSARTHSPTYDVGQLATKSNSRDLSAIQDSCSNPGRFPRTYAKPGRLQYRFHQSTFAQSLANGDHPIGIQQHI